MRYDEKSISSKTYQPYDYRGFGNVTSVTSVTSLKPHIKKQRYYVDILLISR